jgi:hypothetical protein
MGRNKPGKIRSAERIAANMAVVVVRDFRDGVIPSKLAYEGPFTAELRASLCLIGWPWAVADQAARAVVAEALRLARAARPGWAEGQQAFTGLDVVRDSECRRCGNPLRTRQVHYCSSNCASAWWKKFNREAA